MGSKIPGEAAIDLRFEEVEHPVDKSGQSPASKSLGHEEINTPEFRPSQEPQRSVSFLGPERSPGGQERRRSHQHIIHHDYFGVANLRRINII